MNNALVRFIIGLLYVARMMPVRMTKRLRRKKHIKVDFIWTPARRIIIKRELPFGHLTCASVHALTDANRQMILIKVGREPEEFSLVSLEIAGARSAERAYDRRVRLASPFFPKEKIKPQPYSQKRIDEDVARKSKERPLNLLAADGATHRGTYPKHLQGNDSFIVTNGIFPDQTP